MRKAIPNRVIVLDRICVIFLGCGLSLQPEILQLFIKDDLLPSQEGVFVELLLQEKNNRGQEIDCCSETRQLIGFTFLTTHCRMGSKEKNALNTFQIQSLTEITEEVDSDKLLFLVWLVLLYPREFHRYIYLSQIET